MKYLLAHTLFNVQVLPPLFRSAFVMECNVKNIKKIHFGVAVAGFTLIA